MPAKDLYHDAAKKSLTKDGWQITNDPFTLKWGSRDLFIDLGTEQLLAGEKDSRKIAVEIKSFTGASPVADLEKALGQYILYNDILARIEPGRLLYLAVTEEVFSGIFTEPIGEILIENKRLKLLVFDQYREVIVRWIP